MRMRRKKKRRGPFLETANTQMARVTRARTVEGFTGVASPAF
jgi:hypothetical protein